MRILLDTHAFLWFVAGDASLSMAARATIETPANDVFLSVASAWEVAIKASIGKLTLDAPTVGAFFEEQMEENGFAYLPIDPAHAFRVATLPFHHRDPFDRLIIAQALEEGLPLVTRELETFTPYGVTSGCLHSSSRRFVPAWPGATREEDVRLSRNTQLVL